MFDGIPPDGFARCPHCDKHIHFAPELDFTNGNISLKFDEHLCAPAKGFLARIVRFVAGK